MLQREYPDQMCSIARALEIVGERWTLLIVRELVVGSTRFEEFQDVLGIATNTLTNRLKLLTDEGVVERVPDPQRRGRPMYVLTEKGAELGPVLFSLLKWGDRHYPTPNGPPRLTLHAGCGGSIDHDWRCDRCGRRAEPGELELQLAPWVAGAKRRSGA